jgi:hypothetical protein
LHHPVVSGSEIPGTKYQGQTTVSGLYRQIELIAVGQLFPRSAGRAGPSAPTDHLRDLFLKAFTAQDETTVGCISKAVPRVLPFGRCPAGTRKGVKGFNFC